MSEAQQKLMSALEGLMLEKPMDVIRAVEIAERAGVSKQTFYNHYADKYAPLRLYTGTSLKNPQVS